MKEPANINKVLEIDMDTERKDMQLIIRQAATVGYDRERQPNTERDLKDDMVILVNALGGTVLKAESDGTCKKGEAMKRVIELLHDVYVDATAEVFDREYDSKGTIIN